MKASVALGAPRGQRARLDRRVTPASPERRASLAGEVYLDRADLRESRAARESEDRRASEDCEEKGAKTERTG